MRLTAAPVEVTDAWEVSFIFTLAFLQKDRKENHHLLTEA